MVECEYTTVVFTNVARIVLIDTWWNVNDKVYTIYNADGVVLIDTWWNVNENANLAFMEIFAF